ncbi:MAG: tripartite tricarboxylate transporter substrate binding protein [Reyranellaceae bacterium]
MITRRVALSGMAALAAGTAEAQEEFPSKPVTILVGFAAGGGGDISARWIADYIREKWKVTAVVENRPGAGATIALAQLARAKPDGYTVALATTSPFAVAPYFQPVPYQTDKDFTFLFQYLVSAQPLFVRSDSPFKTAQELVDWAKANPGKLNWSTASTNGGPHIATEAAFRYLGITAQYIPYKGGADAILGLLSGQIDALVAAEFPSHAAAGKIRLLAESGLERIAGFPDVPTYKQLGWPVGVPIFYGLAAPAGVPAPVIAKWEALGKEMMTAPGYAELMAKLITSPSFLDSKDFTATVVGSYREMGELIPKLGLKQN